MEAAIIRWLCVIDNGKKQRQHREAYGHSSSYGHDNDNDNDDTRLKADDTSMCHRARRLYASHQYFANDIDSLHINHFMFTLAIVRLHFTYVNIMI